MVDRLFYRLGDVNDEDQQSGGYHISVEKDCSYYTSQSLYYYVGNEPPDDMPGKVGNLIDLIKRDESDRTHSEATKF